MNEMTVSFTGWFLRTREAILEEHSFRKTSGGPRRWRARPRKQAPLAPLSESSSGDELPGEPAGAEGAPVQHASELVDLDDLDEPRPVNNLDLARVLVDRNRDAAGELGGPLHDVRPREWHSGPLDSAATDENGALMQSIRVLGREYRDEELTAHEGVELHAAGYRGRRIQQEEHAETVPRGGAHRAGDLVGDTHAVAASFSQEAVAGQNKVRPHAFSPTSRTSSRSSSCSGPACPVTVGASPVHRTANAVSCHSVHRPPAPSYQRA